MITILFKTKFPKNNSIITKSKEIEDQTLCFSVSSRHEDKWQQPRGLHSPSSSSIKSFDLQVANWRIESLGRDSDSGSDEEFFDCQEMGESNLAKWSSLDLLTEEETETTSPSVTVDHHDDSIFSPTFLQRVASERGARRALHAVKVNSLDASCPDSPNSGQQSCSTSILLLVFHAGSVLGESPSSLQSKIYSFGFNI